MNWRGPWLRSVRQVTDGPMRIGTRYEPTCRFFGRDETVTTELTKLDPATRMAWRQVGTGSLAINDGTYGLEAVEGRTRFTVTGAIGATGWRRLIVPAFGRYLNRAAVQQHRQLVDALSRSRG